MVPRSDIVVMTNQKTIEDISLLGGHPALDFVNTVDSRGERWGPEILNAFGDLVTWARRLDVIDHQDGVALLSEAAKSPGQAEKELIHARELREALHRIFLTESDGLSIREDDLALLNKAAQRAQSQRTLVGAAGGIEWRYRAAEQLATIADRVGWLAAELLTSRSERRPVRACQGPNCGWLFLDQSRNGHRRWCSDKTCGSHARVRKFRAMRAD
jgi:predicted RNA-binding Zn ribbon-like protein